MFGSIDIENHILGNLETYFSSEGSVCFDFEDLSIVDLIAIMFISVRCLNNDPIKMFQKFKYCYLRRARATSRPWGGPSSSSF